MPKQQKADAPATDPRLADGFASSLQAIGQVNALLVTRCLELQTRVANLVAAEIAGYWREMMKHLAMTQPVNSAKPPNSLTESFAGPFGDPHNALEMQEISRQWLELASIAQSAFARAFTGSFSRAAPIPQSRLAPERRVSAVVVPFPERRAMKE